MAGVGSKPGHKQGGRKKGTPNRLTTDLRQIILGALEEIEPARYMKLIALKYPVAFCTLLGKLIPRDVNVALPTPPEAGTKAGMIELGRRLAFVLAVADSDAVEKKAKRASKSGGNAVKPAPQPPAPR